MFNSDHKQDKGTGVQEMIDQIALSFPDPEKAAKGLKIIKEINPTITGTVDHIQKKDCEQASGQWNIVFSTASVRQQISKAKLTYKGSRSSLSLK